MIPIGIVGFTLKDRLDALLESPAILLVVGCMLLVTAALLAFAYYAKPRQKAQLSYRDAFLIGVGAGRGGAARPVAFGIDDRYGAAAGQPQADGGAVLLPDGAGPDPGRNLLGIDEGQPRRAGDRARRRWRPVSSRPSSWGVWPASS